MWSIICPVCTDYLKTESVNQGLPCGHIFHHKWVTKEKKCAICNAATEEGQIALISIDMNQELANEAKKNEELTKDNEGMLEDLHVTKVQFSKKKKENVCLQKQIEEHRNAPAYLSLFRNCNCSLYTYAYSPVNGSIKSIVTKYF